MLCSFRICLCIRGCSGKNVGVGKDGGLGINWVVCGFRFEDCGML